MSVSTRSRDQPPFSSGMDPLLRMIAPGSASARSTVSVPPSCTDTAHKSSVAGTARKMTNGNGNGKRSSMSFPVQPIEIASSARSSSSSEPSSAALSTPPLGTALFPNQPTDFMVTLAAQERRVLELREELDRAEAELAKLKKQWAHHEAYKKRSEIRSREQKLGPVKTSKQLAELQADEEPEDLMIRRGVELDKRRALLLGLSRDSRRTVISGGHTRALSLLSPDRIDGLHGPTYQTLNGLRTPNSDESSVESGNRTGCAVNRVDPRVRHSYQETGPYPTAATVGLKDIAEDLKAGLWNFMDDLRQATIGQEALESPPKKINKKPSNADVTATTATKSSSRQSSSSRVKSSLRPPPLRPVTPPALRKKEDEVLVNVHTPKKKTDSGLGGLDDDWGNWDSPISVRSIGGTYIDTDRPTSSDSRMSSATSKNLPLKANEEIPWPALDDFSTQGLTRTASTILKEWERSLTSTPIESNKQLSNEDELRRQEETRLSLSNLP